MKVKIVNSAGCLLFGFLIFPGTGAAAGGRDFVCGEYLARPTAASITVNVIPAEEMQIYAEYGVKPGRYEWSVGSRAACLPAFFPATAKKGEPVNLVMSGLEPSRRYYYRLRWRKDREKRFRRGVEGGFVTRRNPGENFSFAIATDSHLYQKWFFANSSPDEKKRALGRYTLEMLPRTLANVEAAGADFLITLGDEAQVHVYGKEPGPAKNPEDAENRYRITRDFYSRISRRIPVFFVPGNHEAEAPFNDKQQSHSPELARIAREARMKFIPNPESGTYPEGAGEYENYFAWEWGDALCVAIDPFSYTTEFPLLPEQWTLGEKQLAWLEATLKNSGARWKFVFCHQFVGGKPGYLNWGHIYGKGGVNAVGFGQQEKIHELMKKYGARVYFYGHDHVYADGVKDGIHYTTCGSSSSPIWWVPNADFRENYENDFIVKPGFVRVDVGPAEVRVAFIETSPEAGVNGRIAAAYTIQTDAERSAIAGKFGQGKAE